MSLFCEYSSLNNESDVELKFIYRFLTYDSPVGLNLDDSQILSKTALRKKLIDKGKSKKYYYPDFLVALRGIPVLVIEAKSPNEDLAEGYAEARLYACYQ